MLLFSHPYIGESLFPDFFPPDAEDKRRKSALTCYTTTTLQAVCFCPRAGQFVLIGEVRSE